jgi:hypothetical protein
MGVGEDGKVVRAVSTYQRIVCFLPHMWDHGCLLRVVIVPHLMFSLSKTKNRQSLPAGLPAEGGQAGFWLIKKAPTVRKGLLKRVATTYSPGFYPSTICAGRLNDSVRNGKRWTLPL